MYSEKAELQIAKNYEKSNEQPFFATKILTYKTIGKTTYARQSAKYLNKHNRNSLNFNMDSIKNDSESHGNRDRTKLQTN